MTTAFWQVCRSRWWFSVPHPALFLQIVFLLFGTAVSLSFNHTLGLLNCLGWIFWSIYWCSLEKQPYIVYCRQSVFCLLATMILELRDFPPVMWIFDAHALWHASSLFIVLPWYKYVMVFMHDRCLCWSLFVRIHDLFPLCDFKGQSEPLWSVFPSLTWLIVLRPNKCVRFWEGHLDGTRKSDHSIEACHPVSHYLRTVSVRLAVPSISHWGFFTGNTSTRRPSSVDNRTSLSCFRSTAIFISAINFTSDSSRRFQ